MKKYQHQIFNTIFIDIETISEKPSFNKLRPTKQSLWKRKAAHIVKFKDLLLTPKLIADLYKEKAAIYAEFGKIVCISIGMFYRTKGEIEFQKKSFYSDNEKELLKDFIALIKRDFNNPNKFNFCGHNIREFDIPYICRRALVNGIKLPTILNLSGKKSWQIDYLIDTLQLWKFGDYKHYTSLALMCDVFGIPDPKTNIDGSMVGEVYWNENELEKIANYCEEDVTAVAYLFAKMIGRDDIKLIPETPVLQSTTSISIAS